MKRIMIALCLLVIVQQRASPQKKYIMETGTDVLKECGEDQEHTSTYCLGYVAGYAAAENMRTRFAKRQGKEMTRVCIPDGLTNGQLATLVHKFVKDHSFLSDEGGEFLVGAALRDSYTCPSSN